MKAIVLLIIVFPWLILGRTDEPEKRKSSKEGDKTAQELREKIREEIKALGKHPWAGEYYEGDGLGINVYLSLAPKAGYVYEWHGCMGLYDRDYGAVEQKGGKLRLSFTLKHQGKGDLGIAAELVPITWGERKYLVPAKEIVGFCNAVNAGWEPRKEIHGRCLLRRGDEEKGVTGFPAIPKSFESYLLSRPIETEIVGVGEPKSSSNEGDVQEVTMRVTLKHGMKAGLLPGMELYVIAPNSVFDHFTLTKADEQQSEGVLTRYRLKGALGLLSLLDTNPKVGWRLSTRSPHAVGGRSNDRRGAATKGD